jgi:hypothetical protein
MDELADIDRIVLPADKYESIVSHCRRKRAGDFRDDETAEKKAYGLLGGRIEDDEIQTTHVFNLRQNRRQDEPYRERMNELMAEHAVTSETPMERRGWVADPAEIHRAQQTCYDAGSLLFGNYHMHRVPWSHDPERDTCTELDGEIARGQGQWVFIVSMVDPEDPTIRAFFEADNSREADVMITEDTGS